MKNSIFEVDVKGFRELQAGKPKWIIVRELLANAMDEQITQCNIYFSYEGRKATITVEDDCPEGFLDLTDVFTLFKTTRKRFNANVRGRFNMGEKQIICLADYFKVVSTTGGIEIDVLNETRTTLRKKRDKGSEVTATVKMTKEEYNECVSYCKQILPTANIAFNVTVRDENGTTMEYPLTAVPVSKIFDATLKTELKDKESGEMKSVMRETKVYLNKKEETGGTAFIYEMGIPICEIDCDYSIDVQQKVPLSSDRDKVDGKYLKNIYAEVLNQTHEEITESTASNSWVRSAIETGKVTKEAVDNVVEERYGDKVVIANPFDAVSIDDAKANGYRLVYSSELSGEELLSIKAHGAISTSSDLFGSTYGVGDHVTPSKTQLKVFALAERISTNFLPFKASSTIVRMKGHNSPLATFAVKGTLITFYDNMIPKDWWEADENGFVKLRMLDLIIHEMCHHFGMHCDRPYLDAITKLGSQVALHSAQNKSFLKL
jgi:hypothetical protein